MIYNLLVHYLLTDENEEDGTTTEAGFRFKLGSLRSSPLASPGLVPALAPALSTAGRGLWLVEDVTKQLRFLNIN